LLAGINFETVQRFDILTQIAADLAGFVAEIGASLPPGMIVDL